MTSGTSTTAVAPGASAGVGALPSSVSLFDSTASVERKNAADDGPAGAVPIFATVTVAVVVCPANNVEGASEPCTIARFAPGTTRIAIVNESLNSGSNSFGSGGVALGSP